jgi:hypothetical protein
VLVLRSAGLNPHDVAGRNLIGEIQAKRRADGSIAGFVSYTAFGILALRSAGEPAGGSTIRWLVASQNEDGGFGVARSSSSDADMTGATLQALAVAGRAKSGAARRAVGYLRSSQAANGGIAQMSGRSPNAQSTAYAVQGLLAVGAGGPIVSRALSYLTRLQRSDGSIAYSATSSQTPVWVTGQALAALERTPLPIAPVARAAPRKRKPRAAATAPAQDQAPKAAAAAPKQDKGKADSGGRSSSEPAPPAAADDSGETPTFEDGAGSEPATGKPASTLRLDPADSDDGGGVSIWVVIAATAGALALLFVFRRRLRALLSL